MANAVDEICCICVEKSYFLEKISQSDVNGVKYLEKLQLCVPNQIWEEELKICNECIENLDTAYHFIQVCSTSEEYRKEWLRILSEIKVKEEEQALLYECDKCGKQFKLKRSLKLHITRIHLKTNRKAKVTNSKQKENIKEEIKEDIALKEIKENDNSNNVVNVTDVEETSTNLELKEEIEIKNLDNQDLVTNDNDNYYSNNVFDDNYSSEDEEGIVRKRKTLKRGRKKRKDPLKCEYCEVIFNRMDKYVQHVRSKHTFEKPFKCDLCDAAYYSSHNLSIHKRKHRNEKPYVCSACGKSFVSSNDLWQHTKTHNAIREYKCTECNRCYKTHSNLRTHKIQMHLDPSLWKFVCTVCGKKFPLNTNLIKHMRRHDGIKPFQCYLCEKRFVEKIDMQTHLLTHSNERSHKCNICVKEYKKKETLRRHLKIEHDVGNISIKKPEKKLHCPMCPKVFAFNNKLQRHLLSHTGEKPVKCDYCEKRFRDKYDRNMHYKKEHNIEANVYV